MTRFETAKERLRLAKDIPLIGLIKELGYEITSDGSYYSMLSPFRGEKQGSLKISKKTPDSWRDFGNGKYGDVIDFVRELFSLNLNEAVEYLLSKRNIPIPTYEKIDKGVNPIEIRSVEPLSHPKLIEYIISRNIGLNQAKSYLKQLTIVFPNRKNPTREHIVLGWKNNSGGYEMRNDFLKVSNAPKDVTNIKGESETENTVGVFEGWPDFLSCLTYYGQQQMPFNCIILNTLSYIEVLLPYIKEKDVIYYGQNDKPADKALVRIKEVCESVADMRAMYSDYNDFNDFICGKKMKRIKSIKEVYNGKEKS